MKELKFIYFNDSLRMLSVAGFICIVLKDTIAIAATLQPIQVPVVINNQTVGQIQAEVALLPLRPTRQGIEGKFTITNPQPYSNFLSNTLGGAISLNWLQIGSIIPSYTILPNPFVDPISGGLGGQWNDNSPWYWNTTLPTNIDRGIPNPNNPDIIYLPNDKTFYNDLALGKQLISNNNNFALNFSDYPGGFPSGTFFQFRTFLIAEFANKEYDTLGGFFWNATIDGNGDTKITFLEKNPLFVPEYANLVSAFGGSGYKKVLKLPNYRLPSTLSPGKVDRLDVTGLPPSGNPFDINYNPINFLTWTNNSFSGNSPGKPNTLLGAFTSQGQPNYQGSPYNDDGGPYESNGGSGLSSIVNPDGTIHLKVTGSGDDDFNGQVYKESVCVEYYGGSGGGGCKTYKDVYQPHPESGQYEVLVKLNEAYFPDSYSNFPSLYRSASFFSLAANDGTIGENIQLSSDNRKVSEPASVLGLFALAGGAVLTKLANKNNR